MANENNQYWDNEVIIDEVQVGSRTKYIISACQKDGKKFVNVREWYWAKNDETPKPGKHGICLPNNEDDDFVRTIINAMLVARISEV